MKKLLPIGIVALLAGCAGASPRPSVDGPSGRWEGFLLHDGLRSPVEVELSEASSAWRGLFSAGDNAVPLEAVRVTPTSVHFELPGEGVFEGAVAGDEMAGRVLRSSADAGSFVLQRHSAVRRDPANPDWTTDFLLGP